MYKIVCDRCKEEQEHDITELRQGIIPEGWAWVEWKHIVSGSGDSAGSHARSDTVCPKCEGIVLEELRKVITFTIAGADA